MARFEWSTVVAQDRVRLIRIKVTANRVVRIYDLSSTTKPWSFVDDVRFNGAHAYLTDAGVPGFIAIERRWRESGRCWKGIHRL